MLCQTNQISIHTPTKGVTIIVPPIILPHAYFNPHSHEGSDVHNLTKVNILQHFNPHSHEGSDLLTWPVLSLILYFNPHSHEGSDIRVENGSIKSGTISIHTPTKGVTLEQLLLVHRDKISIHTPTKGVTYTVFPCACNILYFNPHSHEGSDTLHRKAPV